MPDDPPLPGNLTGTFLVRALRSAFQDVDRLMNRTRDQATLRRHALKLRYWPDKHPQGESGVLMDLDWSWIESCKPRRIGELRIHETICGCDNLRIIFFDPAVRIPLPMIWVLAVMQKKSNHFSKANTTTFEVRRQIVLERFYNT